MKTRASKSKRARKPARRSERPPLLPISEEMKEWAGLISTEVKSWGEVKARPMFGMEAFYRKQRIFARRRAADARTAFAYVRHL